MDTTNNNSSNTTYAIDVQNLTVGYGSNVLMKDLNFTVNNGEIFVILGGSGCGKTTILRLIGGQYAAQSGQVLFEGQDIGKMTSSQLMNARRRMGMLFQFGALFTDLSVYENVAFPLREHTDLTEELLRSLVLMKLNAVGLRGARDLMPAQISGGMARRVALARAIALDPPLIMYDEPFAGLDPISLGITARLIRDLNNALGATSLLVTHDVEETFAIADYVYFIANGRIGAEGTPEELSRSTDPFVRQFLDASPDGPVPFNYPGPTMAQDFGLRSS